MKKGGKKTAAIPIDPIINTQDIHEQISNESQTTPSIHIIADQIKSDTSKKRGRKPKGGKIVSKQLNETKTQNTIANIILHLKCSLSDVNEYSNQLNKLMKDPLAYNPEIPPNILTYDNQKEFYSNYDEQISNECNNDISTGLLSVGDPSHGLHHTNNIYAYVEPTMDTNKTQLCNLCKEKIDTVTHISNDDDSCIQMKDINVKLKELKINLYKNNLDDKKSACFWCTYEYDNPSCYIPKYEMDNQIFGYGSFCRPECAVAYLMKENLDDSMKFERYHLLNQIYGKVYQHKKNIKPAPNPYFLLDKFYGNLSIQEYRKLLKTEHMLLVIDKPMTRILPELFEDNDNFILDIYGDNKTTTKNSIYKVKKHTDKQQGQSKTSIMKNKFGLT